jgi:DeoR family transcriptional regulator, fructose operon transcriptional repressor
MSYPTRKHKILELIEKNDSVEVPFLAEFLDTSEITIRRDLNRMAAEGLVYRTHGGAMKISLATAPVAFAQKVVANVAAKKEVALKAAQLISDGDVIFMDCGSTVFEMCEFIKNKSIKVVTNSLPVAFALAGSAVQLNFVGGEIDAERQAAHGQMAVEHISRYRVQKAFLGFDGISVAYGISANSEKEVEITKAMYDCAAETYFLGVSQKLNSDKYLPFLEIEKVKHLILENKLSESLVKPYISAGIEVI